MQEPSEPDPDAYDDESSDVDSNSGNNDGVDDPSANSGSGAPSSTGHTGSPSVGSRDSSQRAAESPPNPASAPASKPNEPAAGIWAYIQTHIYIYMFAFWCTNQSQCLLYRTMEIFSYMAYSNH